MILLFFYIKFFDNYLKFYRTAMILIKRVILLNLLKIIYFIFILSRENVYKCKLVVMKYFSLQNSVTIKMFFFFIFIVQRPA